jgi:hypothetical protein
MEVAELLVPLETKSFERRVPPRIFFTAMLKRANFGSVSVNRGVSPAQSATKADPYSEPLVVCAWIIGRLSVSRAHGMTVA